MKATLWRESAAMSCWAAPFDVSLQPAKFFYLLRHDQLDCLWMRSGPTLELTRRPTIPFNLPEANNR
jgi:hypothetical protein